MSEITMPRNKIVQSWLDGQLDAGGCIAALERDLAAERERADRLIAFLADDALAMTYQSLAQYRQAAIDAARRK